MAARNDYDDFFGDDDVRPVTDTRADGRLYRVPIGRLAPNLVNPRQDFGTEDDLIDFGKSLQRRQNQACPVVSRVAYLKLWPDHGDRVGDIDYVLVSGERRYRAATAVGLLALDCVVNDDFAADRKTFMEAVVSENVDRQNFDPVEEAYAVQALVAEFGSNRAVAQHFERVDGWVTQRILLTHLAPEIQALVRKKAIPLESARTLGKLARDGEWTADQQAAWWEQEQGARKEKASERKAARQAVKVSTAPPNPRQPERPEEAQSVTAVKQDAPTARPAAPETESFTAVKQTPAPATVATAPKPDTPAATPAADSAPAVAVPEPRPEAEQAPTERPGTTRLDWADGPASMRIAYKQWTGHLQRRPALGEFLELVGGPEKFAADLAAASSPEYRSELIKHLQDTL